VYAPQFRELEKLENSHQVSSWIHELDRSRTEPLAIREVKEDSDAVLSARSSDDEIVDITTLKEQIASTRADLHTSVRKANKIGILRTRSPKLLQPITWLTGGLGRPLSPDERRARGLSFG
jgi:hypothetical protein